jgi:hypothetical protein
MGLAGASPPRGQVGEALGRTIEPEASIAINPPAEPYDAPRVYSTDGAYGLDSLRMAIGADGRGVVRLVLRDSLAAVTAGIAAGLVAAFLVNSALRSMFYGVAPGDPMVLLSAAGGFLLVAAAAAALPAWSATRVGPVLALRQ